MRILLASILSVYLLSALAGGFQVFQIDGFYGVKDEEGEILIPAVYEELGWSDDNKEIFNEVIGFKKNNLWGLLSIKNKILAENNYHSLEPFGDNHLKASVKGKFSNQLFYGILELGGDIEVSFNYASLERLNDQVKAAVFDGNTTKIGLINFKNERLIPIDFKSLYSINQWLIGEDFGQKSTIFNTSGKSIVDEIDSVYLLSDGLVCYSRGLAGYIKENNKVAYSFDYKGFQKSKSSITPIHFETWEIFAGSEKKREQKCDSLAQKGPFWIVFLNGAEHITTDNGTEFKDFAFQEACDDQAIIRHTINNKWSVIDAEGELIVQGYDYIAALDKFYFARKDTKWDIYNRFGTRINKFSFDQVKEGVEQHFIAKRDDYWGVIDFKGETFLEFKYDAINLEAEELYSIQFFGKWGIMNKYGNWMINPNFQELQIHDHLAIGKRGALRSFFYDGALFANLTYKISYVTEGVPVLEDSGRYGLINPTNSMLYRPDFDTVVVKGELLHFYKDSAIMLLHRDGIMKVDFEEGFEAFGDYSYGHVPVKRNGKWGFVDRQSRLRIANRYDEVRPFSQGFAPIKLKGKWGFIDTKENLVVQPHYDQVSPFNNGFSIFQTEEGLGLVNAHGNELLSGWVRIERLETGNFLVEDKNGMLGLVNEKGGFILRPDFKSLRDVGEEVIVEKNGKIGVLDYARNQLLKIGYSRVEKTDNYLVARK